ncbi:MAG: protein kinase [Myxococcota bacterium]
MPRSFHAPVPLKLAGRYELMRTQATDANTASLLAWDTRLKRWRSIRVARPGDEAASRRMLAVAQWAAKLEHPALERVIDVGTDGTVVYVVRDRLVGSVSDHLRRRGGVAPEWALQVVTRCAEGLAWAHPRGIVHGHPRPDVVQFSEDGSAVLTSFGQRAVLRDTPETRAGADWAHLAPELRQAWQPDATTDVYALGALLYMLLAGKPSADLFYAEAYEGLLSAIPRSLRPLLHRACAFAPTERYTTSSLYDALRQAQGNFPPAQGSAPWLESTQDFPDRSQYDGMDAILTEIAPHLDTPQPREVFGPPDPPSQPSSSSFHDDATVPPGTSTPTFAPRTGSPSATPPSASRNSGPLVGHHTGNRGPRHHTGNRGPQHHTGNSGPTRNTGPGGMPIPVYSTPAPPPHMTPQPPPSTAPATYAPPPSAPSGGESFMGVQYFDEPDDLALPSPGFAAAQAMEPAQNIIRPSSRTHIRDEGGGATFGQVARVILGGTLFGLLITTLAVTGYWFFSTQDDRADQAFIVAVEAEEATVAPLVMDDRDLARRWEVFSSASPETRAASAASFVRALEDRSEAAPLPVEIETAIDRLVKAKDDWTFYR